MHQEGVLGWYDAAEPIACFNKALGPPNQAKSVNEKEIMAVQH